MMLRHRGRCSIVITKCAGGWERAGQGTFIILALGGSVKVTWYFGKVVGYGECGSHDRVVGSKVKDLQERPINCSCHAVATVPCICSIMGELGHSH